MGQSNSDEGATFHLLYQNLLIGRIEVALVFFAVHEISWKTSK